MNPNQAPFLLRNEDEFRRSASTQEELDERFKDWLVHQIAWEHYDPDGYHSGPLIETSAADSRAATTEEGKR